MCGKAVWPWHSPELKLFGDDSVSTKLGHHTQAERLSRQWVCSQRGLIPFSHLCILDSSKILFPYTGPSLRPELKVPSEWVPSEKTKTKKLFQLEGLLFILLVLPSSAPVRMRSLLSWDKSFCGEQADFERKIPQSVVSHSTVRHDCNIGYLLFGFCNMSVATIAIFFLCKSTLTPHKPYPLVILCQGPEL